MTYSSLPTRWTTENEYREIIETECNAGQNFA